MIIMRVLMSDKYLTSALSLQPLTIILNSIEQLDILN